MSEPALAVYETWLTALNERDWDRFGSLLADDVAFTFSHLLPADRATLRGRSRVVGSFKAWQSGFERLEGQLIDAISEPARASVRLWWRGSTRDRRPVAFAACHWLTVEEGQIVEIVDFFDEKGYLEQVGE